MPISTIGGPIGLLNTLRDLLPRLGKRVRVLSRLLAALMPSKIRYVFISIGHVANYRALNDDGAEPGFLASRII
jgi:hypothetical protein